MSLRPPSVTFIVHSVPLTLCSTVFLMCVFPQLLSLSCTTSPDSPLRLSLYVTLVPPLHLASPMTEAGTQ